MLEKNSSTTKQILDEFKKALPSHFLSYSTSLSAHSTNNVSCGMKNCVDARIEIIKLIKFSPKCEKILESIKMTDMIVAKSHKELKDDLTNYALL